MRNHVMPQIKSFNEFRRQYQIFFSRANFHDSIGLLKHHEASHGLHARIDSELVVAVRAFGSTDSKTRVYIKHRTFPCDSDAQWLVHISCVRHFMLKVFTSVRGRNELLHVGKVVAGFCCWCSLGIHGFKCASPPLVTFCQQQLWTTSILGLIGKWKAACRLYTFHHQT